VIDLIAGQWVSGSQVLTHDPPTHCQLYVSRIKSVSATLPSEKLLSICSRLVHLSAQRLFHASLGGIAQKEYTQKDRS